MAAPGPVDAIEVTGCRGVGLRGESHFAPRQAKPLGYAAMPASPPANPLPSPRLTRTAGLLGTAGVLLTGVLALMQAPARMPP